LSRRRRCPAVLLPARALLQLAIALPLGLWVACVTNPDVGAAARAQHFSADTPVVLDAAEEVLSRQGYVFEDIQLDDGVRIAQQIEQITRPRGSDIKGTIVRTQVVIEATPDATGTNLSATFNISLRRPTGERRTFSPETPQASRLRREFYMDLINELGEVYTSSADTAR